MKKNLLKKLQNWLLILLIFCVSVVLYFFDAFSFLELKSYDSRMKFAGKFTKPSEEICLILLDQESIDWAKEEMGWNWPWPRSAYGDIVNYFSLADSKALVFDVLYTENSVYGPEDDLAFANACKENGKVILTLHEDKDSGKVLFPVSPIRESATLIGGITSSKDKDDIIRKANVFQFVEDDMYFSLGFAPLMLDVLQNPQEIIQQGLDYNQYFMERIGEPLSLLNDGITANLRFQSSLEDYLPYRASDILKSYYAVTRGEEPLIPPENFTDTYTFFAFYAPGLFDICSVPNSQVYPGVGVHVTLLDNLLNKQFIRETPWYISLLWILALSFLGVFAISLSEKQKSTKNSFITIILFPSLTLPAIFLLSYGLFALGFWLPLIVPIFTFSAAFALALLLSYSHEGKQRRFIKNAFKQYVSPTVIENLIQNPESLKLGGEKRNLSIFFSDIQGFTSISENMEPEELTEFLNDFLTEMSNIILEYGGTIDKYEGDAIVAFWNAPTDVENHELCALHAALKCQERLEEMRASYTYRLGSPVYMRIGLNTGNAVVGNLGSRERFDYTMIGDSVNLGSRLEGLNKEFGTYTMCSKALKDAIQEKDNSIKWRELAKVSVVGKKAVVTVFEPFTLDKYKEKEKILNIFEQGRNLFYKGDFLEAEKTFSLIAEEDPPAAAYIKKCQKLYKHYSLDKSLTLDDWQGIWIASGK